MLNKLRTETEVLHKEIEQQNLADLIIDHTISLEEYKLLLLQNYVAYAVVEAEIQKHNTNYISDKTQKLQEDLKNLQIHSASYVTDLKNDFHINSEAEALGAQYVVEGSGLGGMLIAKNIPQCKALMPIEKHFFFNGNPKSLESWKSFCKGLKEVTFSAKEEEQAVQKAKETFLFFGKVFTAVSLV